MLRMSFLCLALGAVAQVMPQGCPLALPEDTGVPAAERKTITTQANTPAAASVGDSVSLVATATGDAEGGAISYSWLQISGAGVQISGADQATASFTAPSLPADQTLAFMVTTTNERGDVGQAVVEVQVLADPDYGAGDEDGGSGIPGAPIARAGVDREVAEGSAVTLDASNSSGDELTYEWEQASGTTVELDGADSAEVSFTAPDFDLETDNRLELQLTVRDRRGRSDTDEVTVRVREGENAEPKPRVSIRTSLGTFVLELDRESAPITVENFLEYVDDDFYDGTLFHRVIADFVVQGGGYDQDLELKETNDPIANESNNGLSNERGTVAMARTNAPDSATSQFYINLVDNPSLDFASGQPGYAVFGEVVEGMDVVDAIGAMETESREGLSDIPVEDVILIEARRVAAPDGGPSSQGGGSKE